jgi:hypothetical protein
VFIVTSLEIEWEIRASLDKQNTIAINVGLFFFFVVLGFELRAYTLSHSTSPTFVMGFFEIGSHELFG